MPTITIFIDESGTLPDPKDKVVIVAAVATELPQKINQVSKSVRKYLKSRKRKLNEIKFYRSGERTKKKFLQELAKQEVDIFALTVEKYGRKIADTPKNFALLCWLLLEDCFLYYTKSKTKLIFDRHFHLSKDQTEFNLILSKLLGKKLDITHVDSQIDQRVNTADMIAGSILWLKTGKDAKFYELVKDRMISEKTVNWKEIKKKLYNEKVSPNQRKRSSKRE
ncbi:DUF3800 domain-containing protein [Patescibacteria group bacterium]|nr:DUF3800 domain-containing protein [Patescibacteria group bacterium]